MKEKERVEVLLEEIRDKVSLVAEGHEVLRSEMRQMEGRLSDRIDRVEVGQFGLMNRIDRLETGQNSLGNKIDRVHTSLKNEIKITGLAINDKLDEHIKQPSHA
ncbi:MAG: hypothetical protein ABIH69_05465 [bacterium]